jgi:hypothetical protein
MINIFAHIPACLSYPYIQSMANKPTNMQGEMREYVIVSAIAFTNLQVTNTQQGSVVFLVWNCRCVNSHVITAVYGLPFL